MSLELEHNAKYSKIGPFLVSSELFLDLVFNNNCNCSCKFCIAKTPTFCEENYNLWKKNLKRCLEIFDVKDIIILGGEATIDKKFFEKLEVLEKIVKNKKIDNIILTTNGIMLKNENFLNKLINTCITSVNISIMNFDHEKNNKIYGTNTLTKQQLLHVYNKLKQNNKTMRINCNIYKGNLDSVSEMNQFAQYFNGCCDAIKFSPLMPTDMFNTCPEIIEYTNKVCLSKKDIFDLYNNFAQTNTVTANNNAVFGLVEYKEVDANGQKVILKYQQVEDTYNLNKDIPTLKLYSNGNLSNEWDYNKNILNTLNAYKNLKKFIINQNKHFPNWLKNFDASTEGIKIIVKKNNFENIFLSQYKNEKIIGFYTINNGQFKNLYIMPKYRKLGIATKVIEYEKKFNNFITIAVAEQNSKIRNLISRIGFYPTDVHAKGKFDNLQIFKWQKKIGAFVGKFYPPHIGHLSVIDDASKKLDEVWVVISKNDKTTDKITKKDNFKQIDTNLIKQWFCLHYKNNPKVKVAIFDETGLLPYPKDQDKWSEKFKKQFPFVNVKIGDESYRELNEKYFPECEFYPINRDIIPIHSTQIRQNLKQNIKYIIKEAQNYFKGEIYE